MLEVIGTDCIIQIPYHDDDDDHLTSSDHAKNT
jgi:hypothetical protein